jgi:hypothetical protein
MKSSFRVFSLIIVLALLMVTAISAAAKPSGTVDVQILAVNDFTVIWYPLPVHQGVLGPLMPAAWSILPPISITCARKIPIRSWYRPVT